VSTVTYRPLSGGRKRKGRVVRADDLAVVIVGERGFETTLRADVECKRMPCADCDAACAMRGGSR
jgi:hypothetical protein